MRTEALAAKVLTLANRPSRLEETEPLLTREDVIRATQEDGVETVAHVLLPAVKTFFKAYVQAHGWFYPDSDVTLEEVVFALRTVPEADDRISGRSSVGCDYLKNTFRSFWDVDGGPVNGFEKGLDSVVKYRLGLNNSKDYTYKLADGSTATGRETFDINIKNIRRGYVVQRMSASFFKPAAATAIYKRWIRGTDTPTVWDPSCGFGARLLGFAAAFPKGEYLGNEPATKIHADAEKLGVDLCSAGLLASVHILAHGSEVERLREPQDPGEGRDVFDLVFTSPPYFNLEKYYDEPGQCWKDFPTLPKWADGYLLPTLRSAHWGLKPGAHLVLNVDDARKETVEYIAKRAGFGEPVFEHRLALGSDHFMRKKGNADNDRGEPVLVFQKT
jgi:hypothetical protein